MSKRRADHSPRRRYSGDEIPDVQAAHLGEVGNRDAPGEDDEVIYEGERRVVERSVDSSADNDDADSEVQVVDASDVEGDPTPAQLSASVEKINRKVNGQTAEKGILTAERQRLEAELRVLPGVLREQEEAAVEARVARKQRFNVERGKTETWWKRRCEVLARHYFAQYKVAETLGKDLQAAQELLTGHKNTLLFGLSDKFFSKRFKNLHECRERLLTCRTEERGVCDSLIHFELLHAEVRTLANCIESLQVRILELKVASLSKRRDTELSEAQRLKSRLDALGPFPNPDDTGSDIFEVSVDTSVDSEEDASEGTECEDERDYSSDNHGGLVPGDHPDIPSTSRGSP